MGIRFNHTQNSISFEILYLVNLFWGQVRAVLLLRVDRGEFLSVTLIAHVNSKIGFVFYALGLDLDLVMYILLI